MPVEKSAGAVIFRLQPTHHPPASRAPEKGKIYYLLLHYPSNAKAPRDYWDFPKGHIEKGEKIEETVKREVEEETGLKDIKFAEGFKEWIKYFFRLPRDGKTVSPKGERQKPKVSGAGVGVSRGKIIFKIVTFLLAEAETEEVKISPEHIGYQWLPYKEALKQLKFKNAREILKKSNDFLSKKDIRNS
jgi:bis(5'-nucleosidyl)-tetraphosphatase